jgi:CheY-like chemotaxis protein
MIEFTREEFENAHTRVNRYRESVRAMVRIAATPIGCERGSVVTTETVASLKGVAAVVEAVKTSDNDRSFFIATNPGIPELEVKRMALALKAKILASKSALHVQDLDARVDRIGAIHSYLGVPILDADGAVTAVAGIFGGKGRHFGEEDEWWLKLAGQLFADSSAYHKLDCSLRSLEEMLKPKPVLNEVKETEVKKTVLVIDDDRYVNDLLCEFLDMQGYTVENAFNGVEAIQKFQPAKHDLAITDVAMPLMNGWELIAALRVRAPQLPIILISGYSTAEWNQDYLHKQGVSAVMRKPLDLDELALEVSKLLPVEFSASLR